MFRCRHLIAWGHRDLDLADSEFFEPSAHITGDFSKREGDRRRSLCCRRNARAMHTSSIVAVTNKWPGSQPDVTYAATENLILLTPGVTS
jgi:hypothetical protein